MNGVGVVGSGWIVVGNGDGLVVFDGVGEGQNNGGTVDCNASDGISGASGCDGESGGSSGSGIENSQTEKINIPKDLNESFDLGQTSTTTPIPILTNKESNQLLTTFGSDILTNYYEFQPKALFAQYNSLLGDSGGGGGQIPNPPSDGGTGQERGVRIIANSFCSTLDDSIIQHDASTNDTFFVVLTGAPTSGVKVSLKVPDSLQGILSSDELYFTSENWNIPQKVTFSPESLGVPTKDEGFKLIAIASQEGGYTGTEHDSAIFNNSAKHINQASTEIKRAENSEEDPVNLDVERITVHEELSPMFTILRIISFPAIAFISFALNSIERFHSDISFSNQSTDQNNTHQTPAFQIGPIEANHLNGIGSESDFRLANSSQHSSGASSLLLAQTIQPTDSYF
ncbi:hypothetical protein OAD91_01705 [Synechococcus sp. AH-551-E19]|nr:hypothetical protein [Synechococcus sp. AH-551-E19]